MLLRLVTEDSFPQTIQTDYAFCHAIHGFKFKQVDFGHFKKSLSKTAVIASFIVYKCHFSTNLVQYLIHNKYLILMDIYTKFYQLTILSY